jgi:hypothetical protein
MSAHLFCSVRSLRPSISHSKAIQEASGECPQAGGSDRSRVRSRADADDALARGRMRTVSLLNLLRYAEAEAAEQELQTTAVLLGAAIADVALELEGRER